MSPAALSAMWMSLQLAGITLLIATPLATALSWWMARARWRGQMLLETVILLPLGLPPAVIGFGLLLSLDESSVVGRWLRDDLGWSPHSYPVGALMAACIMTVPMMARMLRPAFEALDPMLQPVARTLGATGWHAWRTVTLPLTLPAIGSAMALGFVAAWGESGAVLILASSVAGDSHASTPPPTAMQALWQSISTGRDNELATELASVSVGMAAASIALSERLRRRWRWQHNWQGCAHRDWRTERP